jgi:hypothetical protein
MKKRKENRINKNPKEQTMKDQIKVHFDELLQLERRLFI